MAKVSKERADMAGDATALRGRRTSDPAHPSEGDTDIICGIDLTPLDNDLALASRAEGGGDA